MKRTRRFRGLVRSATLLGSTALATTLAPSASAQAVAPEPVSRTSPAPTEVPVSPTPSAAEATPVADQSAPGDIIVTAQKQSQSIQRVPISMQALGTEALDQHQVQSFDDYTKLLPSVSFQSFGPGQSQLFFRGISSGGDGLPGGSLPTSGVYLDEIPVTTIGALLDVHIYDVARVEALSGPQGTLYGASSLSGTLRIITNKPDPSKLAAGYDLQLNKFGKGGFGGTAEGFVNLPLNDRMAVRASGFYDRAGGFIDNVLASRTYQRASTAPDGTVVNNPLTVTNAALVKNDFNTAETYGGRLALGIDLDDDWTVTPTVVAQDQRTKGAFLFDPRIGDLKVTNFVPSDTHDRWYQAALTIQGKLSDWDVIYSGGYLQRQIDTMQDYSVYTVVYDQFPDYTYFPDGRGGAIDPTQIYTTHQRISKQTHEIRVSSPTTARLRLTTGMFMQRQQNENTANYELAGLGAIPNSPAVVGDDLFLTRTQIVNRDYAAFGQVAYDLTSKLMLTVGGRLFIADNTLRGF